MIFEIWERYDPVEDVTTSLLIGEDQGYDMGNGFEMVHSFEADSQQEASDYLIDWIYGETNDQ